MLLSLFKVKSKGRITPILLILISLLSVLVQVSLNYILSKHATVETFGEYRNFLALVSFSGVFHIGFVDGLYLNWLLKKDKPHLVDIISIIILQSIFIGILFFFLHQKPLIFAILIQIFVQNLFAFSNNVLQKEQKFILSNLLVVCNQLLLTLLVYVYAHDLTIYKIVDLYNALYILSTSIILSLLLLKKRIHFDNFGKMIQKDRLTAYFADTLTVGFPILLTGLVFVGFQNIDKIILAQYYSKYDFGLYSFGFTIINIIIGIVLSVTNFILRKFIDMPLDILQSIFTKLTIGLAIICVAFLLVTPILFSIINIYTPQYATARPFVLALTTLILPYILLQLLIFNLFKILNKTKIFFYNSVFHLFMLTVLLLTMSYFGYRLEFIPYFLLIIFLSWYLSSEYFLAKCNYFFLRGLRYRIISVGVYILFSVSYVLLLPPQ